MSLLLTSASKGGGFYVFNELLHRLLVGCWLTDNCQGVFTLTLTYIQDALCHPIDQNGCQKGRSERK